MIHDIKIHPQYFELHIARQKEFELRRDDRPYAFGDTLRQLEFDPETETFSGRVAVSRVTCALRNIPGLQPGYVALGTFFLQLELLPSVDNGE